MNKKTLITTASIISLLCIVFLGKGLYKSISGIAQDESIQSDTEQKSNSIDTSSNEKTKNSSSNTSNNGKNQSSSTKSSSKDGISNEVKGQDSSSYDNGKASDNKTNVNSEENKSTSASNTDANKETVNEKIRIVHHLLQIIIIQTNSQQMRKQIKVQRLVRQQILLVIQKQISQALHHQVIQM